MWQLRRLPGRWRTSSGITPWNPGCRLGHRPSALVQSQSLLVNSAGSPHTESRKAGTSRVPPAPTESSNASTTVAAPPSTGPSALRLLCIITAAPGRRPSSRSSAQSCSRVAGGMGQA